MNNDSVVTDIKKSFWDYSSLIMGNFWSVVLAVTTIFLLTRIVSTKIYGTLVLFQMITQWFFLFVARWNASAVLRYARQEFVEEDRVNRVVWARLVFILPIMAVAIILTLLFSKRIALYIGLGDIRFVYLIPLYCLTLIMLDFVQNVARSVGKIKIYSLSLTLDKFFILCGIIIMGTGVIANSFRNIVFVYILSALAVFAVLFLFLNPLKWVPPAFDFALIKKIFTFSYPFILISICMVGIGWIDIFFIRQFLNLTDVGIYSLSYRLISLIQMLSTFMATIILPIIISFHAAKRKDLIVEYTRRIVPKIIFLWTVFLCLILYAINYFFPLLVSADFQKAIMSLRFLLCSLSFFAVFSLYSPVIQTYEVVHKGQWGFLLTLLVNIVGDVILIPRIGIIGAAYSTCAAFFVLGFWYYNLSNRILRIRDYKEQMFYTTPVWVVLGGILLFGNGIWGSVVWGIVFVCGLLFFVKKSGLFQEQDLDLIDKIDMPAFLKGIAKSVVSFSANIHGEMESRPKILYVLPSFTLGGTETHLLALIDGLIQKGYKISVCFLYDRLEIAEKLHERHVGIYSLHMKNIYDLRGLFRLWKLLMKHHFSIVHAYLFDANIYAPIVAKLAGVKVVLTSRRNYDDWMKKPHIILQRAANLFTDRILVNAESLKHLVARQEGFTAKNIITIYNSINKERFDIDMSEREKNDIKSELGLKHNEPVIVCVAKFKISKGHFFLVKTAKKIIEEIPNVGFVLVGKGPEEEKIMREVQNLGITGNFIFAGQRDDVAKIVQAADLCVLSSIREGFANTILEYMASGKAVVATDVGGNSEVITNGENGILVPKSDIDAFAGEVITLLKNEAKRTELGKRAKQRINDITFEPDYMAESFNAIYRELLNVKSSPNGIIQKLKKGLHDLTGFTAQLFNKLYQKQPHVYLSYASSIATVNNETRYIMPKVFGTNRESFRIGNAKPVLKTSFAAEKDDPSGDKKIDVALEIRINAPERISLFKKTLRLDRDIMGWEDVEVNLSEFIGREVELEFAAETLKHNDDIKLFWQRPFLVCGNNSRVSDKKNLNVIVISIDPLRQDHMGVYGYKRDTTPHIDNFSRKCAIFANAYSQAPWTTPSHMSLFTSLYPSFHGVDQPLGDTMRTLGNDKKTLAEYLKEKGYLTAAFAGSGSIAARWGFYRGFDIYNETASDEVTPEGHDISLIYKKTVNWIKKNKSEDFFLFFHTYNTHTPYNDRYFVDKEGIRKDAGNEYLTALYDGDIRITDSYFGNFIDMLKTEGLWEHTVIILISDHGEDLGEHYPFEMTKGHGHSLYEDLLRVPIIIYHPHFTEKGMKIDRNVRLIDVMPTILDILNVPINGNMQGKSLLPFLKGKEADIPEYFFAEAICHGPERKMIHNGRYKYIYTAEPDIQKTRRKISPVKMHELYDVKNDPEERRNIYYEKKDIAKLMSEKLAEFIRSSGSVKQKEEDKIRMDEKLKQRLRALGYIE